MLEREEIFEGWTRDQQGEANFTPRKTAGLIKFLQVLSFGGAGVLALVSFLAGGAMRTVAGVLAAIGIFGTLILGIIHQWQVKRARPLCMYCGRPMELIETFFPDPEELKRLFHNTNVITDDFGYVYVTRKDGLNPGDKGRGFEITNKWYACRNCKRHFLAQKACEEWIGTADAVQQRIAEREKYANIRRSLKGKKIVLKKRG